MSLPGERGHGSRPSRLSQRFVEVWGSPQRPLIALLASLAVGLPALRAAINSPRGGTGFRRRTIGLAAIWTVGSIAATPQDNLRRPIGERTVGVLRGAVVAGGALVALFAAGAVVGSRIPFARQQISSVVDHARRGPIVPVTILALVTGATEELFFRGAAHDVAGRLGLPQLASTTVLHAVATAATGNPMLVLASVPLSAVAGANRARTGTILGPVVVHLVWSAGMLLILPAVLKRTGPERMRVSRVTARPI